MSASRAADVIIRRYSAEDGEQLRHFKCYTPGCKWTKPPQRVIREAPDDLAREPGLATVFVAVHKNERIVGVVVFTCGIESLPEPAITICTMGVVRDMRCQGIATDLKGSVLAEAAALGIPLVVSEVHKRNAPMLRVNEKLGVSRLPELTANQAYPHVIRVTSGHETPTTP